MRHTVAQLPLPTTNTKYHAPATALNSEQPFRLCYIHLSPCYDRTRNSALARRSLAHFSWWAGAYSAGGRVAQAAYSAHHRNLPASGKQVCAGRRETRASICGADQDYAGNGAYQSHGRPSGHQQRLLPHLLPAGDDRGHVFWPVGTAALAVGR